MAGGVRRWVREPHFTRMDGVLLFLLMEASASFAVRGMNPGWSVLGVLGLGFVVGMIRDFLKGIYRDSSSERIFSSEDDPLMKVWISQGGVAYAACPECPWERDQGQRTTRELIEAAIAHKREEHPSA